MIFWFLTAILTALAAIVLATPFMHTGRPRTGWVIAVLAPLAALTLYAMLGRPGLL